MWSKCPAPAKPRLPQSGPAISRPVQNPPTTSAPTATSTRMDFLIFVLISYHLQQFLCSQSCITSMLMERLQQLCVFPGPVRKETISRYARGISRRIGNEIDARVAAALPKKAGEIACPVKLGSFHKRLIQRTRPRPGEPLSPPVQCPEGPDRREP